MCHVDAIALLSDLRLGSGECSLERFQIGRFNQYGYGFAASRVAKGGGLHTPGLEELRASWRVEPVIDVVDVVDCNDLHGGFLRL